MRPIKLYLKNIGPFVGKKEIDFTKLGDMFLICGDTGSGKTTIFDAMTYALYGEIPGMYNPAPKTLRSDFAKENDQSSIVFEYTIANIFYKIKRTPPYKYINRNGKESEKQSEVAFYSAEKNPNEQPVDLFSDENQGYTLISNKTNEANQKIQETIGLSSDEFSRIVLLPQGDFSNFLHLNTNERKEALSKLFPVKDYKAITDFALEKYDFYKKMLDENQKQLTTLCQTFSLENAQTELNNFETQEKEIAQKQTEIQSNLMNLSQKLTEAKALNEKQNLLFQTKANLEKLQQQTDFINEQKEYVKKAIAAQSVKPFLDADDLAQGNLQEILFTEEKTKQEIIQAEENLELLKSKKNEIDLAKQEIKKLELSVNDLEKAVLLEKNLEKTKTELQKLFEEKVKINSQIQNQNQLLLPLNAIIEETSACINDIQILHQNDLKAQEELQEALNFSNLCKNYSSFLAKKIDAQNAVKNEIFELEKANKILSICKAEKENLQNLIKEQEKNNMAFCLAQNLKENAPCPVCGSVNHPNIAKELTRDFSLAEQLEAKDIIIAEQEHNQKEIEKTLAGCKTQLIHFEKSCTDLQIQNAIEFIFAQTGEKISEEDSKSLEQKIKEIVAQKSSTKEKTKKELDFCNRALNKKTQAEKNKEKIAEILQPLQNNFDEINSLYIEKKAKEKHQTEEFKNLTKDKLESFSSAIEATNVFKNAILTKTTEITTFENNFTENQNHLVALNATLETLGSSKENAQKQRENTQKVLIEELKKNNFEKIEELENFIISKEKIESKQNEIDLWQKNIQECELTLNSVQKELEGKELFDYHEIEDQINEAQETSEKINNQALEIASKKQTLLEQKKRYLNLEAERETLTKDSALYKKLSEDLSGKNPKALSFESWILGIYLEEITIHASSRLEKISDGRYKLLTKIEKEHGRQKFSGLELEIFDAYTGRLRSCKTLSGGETFLVSISLALALTDVVQSKSGGIQLDSLFIDEGFGTLDEVSLEKALSILDEIRSNRTIGIISHVADLKNRIKTRIELKKTTTGSHISIVSK